jgi:hypothetical protein
LEGIVCADLLTDIGRVDNETELYKFKNKQARTRAAIDRIHMQIAADRK